MEKVWGLLFLKVLQERADVLYIRQTITNGYGIKSTPQSFRDIEEAIHI